MVILILFKFLWRRVPWVVYFEVLLTVLTFFFCISGNGIQNIGARYLAQALKLNSTLHRVGLNSELSLLLLRANSIWLHLLDCECFQMWVICWYLAAFMKLLICVDLYPFMDWGMFPVFTLFLNGSQ